MQRGQKQKLRLCVCLQIQWLTWKDAESGLQRDGAWACGESDHDYPVMRHSLLHPCAGEGQVCCGNHQNAPFLLRYESFFHSKSALLVLAYEVRTPIFPYSTATSMPELQPLCLHAFLYSTGKALSALTNKEGFQSHDGRFTTIRPYQDLDNKKLHSLLLIKNCICHRFYQYAALQFWTQSDPQIALQVWPICGDGLDFVVRLTPSGPRKPAILLKRSYEADPQGSPNRQKIEWRLNMHTGDVIDFLVNPRGNHDCDGVYIVDIQIWTDSERIQAP